jgi:hypothetical protein
VRLPVVGGVVDDDVADSEVVEVAERAFQARRVDGGLQPEMRVVRNGQCLIVGADADQWHDRTKGLLPVDQRFDAHIGDDRGLVVELCRTIPGTPASKDDARALAHGVLQVGVHLRGGRLVVHRPDEGRIVEGIAELPLAGGLQHLVEERFVNPLMDQDPFRRAAHLTGAEEASEDGSLGCAVEVGVLADDHGPVAAGFDQ